MRKLLQYSSAGYLLLLMLIKMMGMQIAVLDYNLNKEFIAASLCENKARPEMKCAGKCYLKKQLARGNDSSESQEEKGASKSFSVDFFESTETPGFESRVSALVHTAAFQTDRIDTPFVAGIFHPPLSAAVRFPVPFIS